MTDVDGGSLFPAFYVYDPTGAVVLNYASNDDVASMFFAAPMSGTYTVVVYDVSSGDAATGPYNLFFTLAPGANKGGALSPGGVVPGQLAEGALDSYTFSAAARDSVEIQVTDIDHSSLVPAFYVYDPTGAVVLNFASNNDIASLSFTAAMSGIYTVVVFDVSPNDSSAGPYTVSLSVTPPAN